MNDRRGALLDDRVVVPRAGDYLVESMVQREVIVCEQPNTQPNPPLDARLAIDAGRDLELDLAHDDVAGALERGLLRIAAAIAFDERPETRCDPIGQELFRAPCSATACG